MVKLHNQNTCNLEKVLSCVSFEANGKLNIKRPATWNKLGQF